MCTSFNWARPLLHFVITKIGHTTKKMIVYALQADADQKVLFSSGESLRAFHPGEEFMCHFLNWASRCT